MVAIYSRHKSLVLLAGIIVLQVLLLAVEIKREAKGRLMRFWTVGAASPFDRAGSYGFGWVRDTWRHYFALQNTTKENEQIRHENDALKLQITQLQGKAAEADRLAALLNFRQSHAGVPMIAARVIGASAGAASQTIQLDRGERDGIRKNMGVITPDGVVGAMLADSRTQSPVGGQGEPLLVMKYVPNDDTVNLGERVITSGMDRIFPRDLPVGTVAEIKCGNPFKQIRIKPAMRSRTRPAQRIRLPRQADERRVRYPRRIAHRSSQVSSGRHHHRHAAGSGDPGSLSGSFFEGVDPGFAIARDNLFRSQPSQSFDRSSPGHVLRSSAGQSQRSDNSLGTLRHRQNHHRVSRFLHRRAAGSGASRVAVRPHRGLLRGASRPVSSYAPHSAGAAGAVV